MSATDWSAADLLQLSGGYWGACALHTGVKLDVFTPVSEQGSTAAQLAQKIGADARALDMLLNALVALGLLRKDGAHFTGTPFSNRHLAKDGTEYLGHIIQHHYHLMASWTRLPEAVVSGEQVRESAAQSEEEYRENFLMGMFDLAMAMAPKLVPHIDLNGRRRLLDLGGGPGTYAINFCRHNPGLQATVYDLPATRPFAEKTIARFGLDDRISFEDGDFIAEGISGSYDVAWLSHILHSEDPAGCATIIEKAVSALEPDGLILVHEFILDDTRDAPLFPALFSLNMLLGTTSGQAYSQQEVVSMLSTGGIQDVHRLDLELPNGAGVIAGRKKR